MTQMLPPTIHSLGLAHHDTKRRGEIDFVLLTQHGVFVLEVKGGRIQRRDGVWYSENRSGEHPLHESPFDQASSAMFELAKTVRERFHGDALAKTLFGYGVVVPDVDYSIDSPDEQDRWAFSTVGKIQSVLLFAGLSVDLTWQSW